MQFRWLLYLLDRKLRSSTMNFHERYIHQCKAGEQTNIRNTHYKLIYIRNTVKQVIFEGGLFRKTWFLQK